MPPLLLEEVVLLLVEAVEQLPTLAAHETGAVEWISIRPIGGRSLFRGGCWK